MKIESYPTMSKHRYIKGLSRVHVQNYDTKKEYYSMRTVFPIPFTSLNNYNNNNDLMKGDINMNKKLTDEQLEELALEARRKYHREWRRNNPDKVREYRRRHWRKKALEMLEEQDNGA